MIRKHPLFEAKNAVENKKIRPKIILNMAAIALNCLVFEKIAFSCTHLGETDGRTDERMDGQAQRIKPPSLSQAPA